MLIKINGKPVMLSCTYNEALAYITTLKNVAVTSDGHELRVQYIAIRGSVNPVDGNNIFHHPV